MRNDLDQNSKTLKESLSDETLSSKAWILWSISRSLGIPRTCLLLMNVAQESLCEFILSATSDQGNPTVVYSPITSAVEYMLVSKTHFEVVVSYEQPKKYTSENVVRSSFVTDVFTLTNPWYDKNQGEAHIWIYSQRTQKKFYSSNCEHGRQERVRHSSSEPFEMPWVLPCLRFCDHRSRPHLSFSLRFFRLSNFLFITPTPPSTPSFLLKFWCCQTSIQF